MDFMNTAGSERFRIRGGRGGGCLPCKIKLRHTKYIFYKITNVQQICCLRSYLVKHEEAGCGMNSTTDLNDEDVDDRS